MPDPIEVRKVPIESVTDASGLAKLIDEGIIEADRVLAVIDELGYRRNEAARALKTNRSRTIGVIADASPRFGPVSTLAAVESAAELSFVGSVTEGEGLVLLGPEGPVEGLTGFEHA